MNKKEIELFNKFIEKYLDELGYHGCNDVDESVWDNWTIEERQQFVKEMHDWNGDPEEYYEDELDLPDFTIVHFIWDRIKKELEVK